MVIRLIKCTVFIVLASQRVSYTGSCYAGQELSEGKGPHNAWCRKSASSSGERPTLCHGVMGHPVTLLSDRVLPWRFHLMKDATCVEHSLVSGLVMVLLE